MHIPFQDKICGLVSSALECMGTHLSKCLSEMQVAGAKMDLAHNIASFIEESPIGSKAEVMDCIIVQEEMAKAQELGVPEPEA